VKTGLPKRRSSASHHEEADQEGSWAVSYGDMITLLLGFFLLFFSIEQGAPTKSAVLLSSIGSQPSRDPASGEDAAPTDPGANESTAKLARALGLHSSTCDVFSGDLSLKKNVTFPPEFPGKVHQFGSKLIVEFPGVSFFQSGRTTLTKAGQKTIRDFVTVMAPYSDQLTIGIRAFTDDRPLSQSGRPFKNNLELSAMRAISTARLIESTGFPLNRVKLGGFGELSSQMIEDLRAPAESATADSSSPQDLKTKWNMSRKVIFVIEPGESQ
jgi:chemotaxis protein MotB